MNDPYSGPVIYPIPKKQLKIPDDKSFTLYSWSGYLRIAVSIISGKEGISIKGSTSPCKI